MATPTYCWYFPDAKVAPGDHLINHRAAKRSWTWVLALFPLATLVAACFMVCFGPFAHH